MLYAIVEAISYYFNLFLKIGFKSKIPGEQLLFPQICKKLHQSGEQITPKYFSRERSQNTHKYRHGCDSVVGMMPQVITACRYTAISHVYECDIVFIQQFDGKYIRKNNGVSLKALFSAELLPSATDSNLKFTV